MRPATMIEAWTLLGLELENLWAVVTIEAARSLGKVARWVLRSKSVGVRLWLLHRRTDAMMTRHRISQDKFFLYMQRGR